MDDLPENPGPLLRLGLETTIPNSGSSEVADGSEPQVHTTPDHIGPYELIEVLGEGGFGTVWRARQRVPIQREVALKVIKPGMDSREVIARFEGERQALALMDHPHIAAVLDAGQTDSGRLYFAMELVQGMPVNEYCDAQRLTIRERLEIFVNVCQAVQHAHQKGILHRDLKPSNVLVESVDGRPVPKIIDFGIAKALQSGPDALAGLTLLQTHGLSVIGTPLYMSPEQAGAEPDVDSRSDIYSLGAMLHELLTGRPPLARETLQRASLDEVLRLVREQDAPGLERSLSQLGTAATVAAEHRRTEVKRLVSQIRGDLDWIVLKALEKDRERRYASVSALAEDIARHLREEPVSAGPPGAAYRLRKLARKHRGTLVAASLVLASLVVGLGLAVYQAIRATRAERVAEARLDDAQQARDAAEALVTEGIHGMRGKLVALGKVELLDDMVEAAQNYYTQLPTELRENDQAQHHLASLALNRATVALAQGDYELHEAQSRECLRILEQMMSRQPDHEALHQESCEALLSLCHLFVERNEQDAIFTYTDALFDRASAWLEKHPGTLWAMRQQVMARTVAAAVMVRELNDPAKSLPVYAEAAEIAAAMRHIHGDKAEVFECEGLIHQGRAKAAQNSKQIEAGLEGQLEAIRCYRKALEIGGSATLIEEQLYSSLYRAAHMIMDRARARQNAEELEQGKQMAIEALEGRARLVELEPGRAEWWRDLANSHNNFVTTAVDPAEKRHHRLEQIRCFTEAIARSPRRPLLYEGKAYALLALGNELFKQPEPDRAGGARAILDGLAVMKQSIEMNDGKPVVKGHTQTSIFAALAAAAEAEPDPGIRWLDEARSLLEALKDTPDTQYGQCLAIVDASRVRVLVALKRDSEAAKEKERLATLGGGSSEPAVLHDRALAIVRRLRAAADPIAKLPSEERAAARAPIQTELAELDLLLNAILEKEPQNPVYRNAAGQRWKLEGDLDRWMNQYPQSISHYEKTIDLLSAETNFDEFYSALDGIRQLHGELKQYDQRNEYAKKVLTLLEERYSTKKNLTSSECQRLGRAWGNLADGQTSDPVSRLHSLEQSEKLSRQAYEIGGAGDVSAYREWLSRCASLGAQLAMMGNLTASMGWAVPLNQHLEKLCETDRDGKALQDSVGVKLEAWYGHLSRTAAHQEAITVTRLLMVLRESLEGKPGYSVEPGRSLLDARLVLARCFLDLGRTSETVAEIQSMRSPIIQKEPRIAVELLRRLADLEDRVPGMKAQAVEDARSAAEMARQHQVGWPGLQATGTYAKYLALSGKPAEALSLASQAWNDLQRSPPRGDAGDNAVNFLRSVTEHVLPTHHRLVPEIDLKKEAAIWLGRLPEVASLTGEAGKSVSFTSVKELWPQYLGHLWEADRREESERVAVEMLKGARETTYPDITLTYAASVLSLDLGKAQWEPAIQETEAVLPLLPDFEISKIARTLALIRSGKAANAATSFDLKADQSRAVWLLAVATRALAHKESGNPKAAEAVLAEIDAAPPEVKRLLSSPTQRESIYTRILIEQVRGRN